MLVCYIVKKWATLFSMLLFALNGVKHQRKYLQTQIQKLNVKGPFTTLNLPNISRSINIDAIYMSKLRISDTIMRKCQVRTVSPTISSSVNMMDVNVIATTCRNSASNKRNAPYIIIPPEIT